MKKILSVLLVITMLLTSVSTGLLGFAGDSPNVSKQRIEIEVDPGQTIYQWGNEIVFNVDVKNNTGSAMEGIEIRTEAYRKNLFKTVDSDVITIDELDAGESTRIQFKYKAINPNFIQKLILLPIYAIFDFLAPLKFKPSSFDKVEKLRVGSFTYRFGFDVYDGTIVPNENENGQNENITVRLYFNLSGVQIDGYPAYDTFNIGESPRVPEVPTKEGQYIFDDWYKDVGYTEKFDFSAPLMRDETIYAKWIEFSDEIAQDIYGKSQFDGTKTGLVKLQELDNEQITAVQVEYKTKYFVADDVEIIIANDPLLSKTPGLIGEPVDISLTNDNELENATITFSYDENKLPEDAEESNLQVIWYDEENERLVEMESVVNEEENTISTTTTHFSRYFVVNSTIWKEAWAHKQLVPRITGESLRYNIVLCLDDSGSMSGERRSVCQEAARSFIDQLLPEDHIGVVKFTDYPTVLVSPVQVGSMKDYIKSKIVLSGNGGTNFTNAVNKAVEMLNSMPETTSENEILKSYIVFLSDGQSSIAENALSDLVKYGYRVLAIGVGSGASEAELRKMADRSGGTYASVANASDIVSIFQALQGEYIGLSVDTDSDNIPDLIETSGMIDQTGHVYHTNPDRADTDGDGISDGEEMGCYDDTKGYFVLNSDPTTPTYVSDRAKVRVTVSFSPVKGITLEPDSFARRQLCVGVVASEREYPEMKIDGKVYKDYLSETLFADAEDVEITITDSLGTRRFSHEDHISAGGYVGSQVWFNGRTDKGTVKISVSGKNFDPVEDTVTYDFISEYMNAVKSAVDKKTEDIQRKATIAAKALKKVKENAKIKNVVNISAGIPEDLKNALQNKFAEEIQREADSFKKTLDNKKNIEKFCKGLISSMNLENEEWVLTTNRATYYVKANNISGFGIINAFLDIHDNKGNSYLMVSVTSSQEQISSAVNAYLEACKDLADEAVNNIINAVIQDISAGIGQLIGMDSVEQFAHIKAKSAVNQILVNAGVSISVESIEKGYKFYSKAEKAISKAEKAVAKDATFDDISGSMKAVMEFLNYDF